MGTVEGAIALQHEVEQFYYIEADLLDSRRFDEWLALFTEDLVYRMPVRRIVYRKQRAQELSAEGEVAHFDDDRHHLMMRVNRIMSGVAWADEPATRTRHLITNVRVDAREEALSAVSNFLVYHSRGETESQVYAGERHDQLTRIDGRLRIATRVIYTDQTVMPANIGVFF